MSGNKSGKKRKRGGENDEDDDENECEDDEGEEEESRGDRRQGKARRMEALGKKKAQKEIFKKSRRNDGIGGSLIAEDSGDEYDENALRKYQLERLR